MTFGKELTGILARDGNWRTFFQMLDLDYKVFYFVKNQRKEFLWMNDPLRELHGVKGDSFLGKTDYDYSPPDLAFLYQMEDESVFTSRRPVLNQPWIVNDKYGRHKWYISSKFPLFSSRNQIAGLAGIMRNVTDEITRSPLNEMSVVVDHIFRCFADKLDIDRLASMVHLSVSQFERKFRGLFHTSPSAFVLKVRIDAAVRLLIESDCSVTEIANQCGFFDNSHFTRYFKKAIGMTPLVFRRKMGTEREE